VAETHAKAGGILTAFGLVPAPVAPSGAVAELALDEDVLISLHRRNQRLSRFWFTDQSDTAPVDALAGKHVVVLDGEDDFVAMLQHVLRVLGMTSETVHHSDYAPGAFDAADVVVVGPGPGDPRDAEDAKIKSVRAAVDELLRSGKPFLAVCLGHQVLCGLLGIPLVYKDIVFQGTQTRVAVMGREENVGFYNTFVARVDPATPLPPGVSVDTDPLTGDIHHLSGPHYRGVQFHAESILTEHGADLVRELMAGLLGG
jgi:phenazine biosynthesis protein phzE